MRRSGHDRRHMSFLLLAITLMLVSAYSILRFFVTADAVSNWIGLPQHAAQVPRLEAEGVWWKWLAIVLPFLAALTLGFGRASPATPVGSESQASLTYTAESRAEKWTTPFVRYLSRLIVSILGTLGLFLVLLFLDFLFYKLGIRSR